MLPLRVCSAVVVVLCVRCSFEGVDIALFSAGGSISKKLGPAAQKAGAVVSGSTSLAGPEDTCAAAEAYATQHPSSS